MNEKVGALFNLVDSVVQGRGGDLWDNYSDSTFVDLKDVLSLTLNTGIHDYGLGRIEIVVLGLMDHLNGLLALFIPGEWLDKAFYLEDLIGIWNQVHRV